MVEKSEMDGENVVKHCGAVSKLFKTLSNPLRLSILCALFKGERTVGSITEETGGSQSQISQFLKRMEYENIILSRREGKFTYYKISDQKIYAIFKVISEEFGLKG